MAKKRVPGTGKKNTKRPILTDSELEKICNEMAKSGLKITQELVAKRAHVSKSSVNRNRNFEKIKNKAVQKYKFGSNVYSIK